MDGYVFRHILMEMVWGWGKTVPNTRSYTAPQERLLQELRDQTRPGESTRAALSVRAQLLGFQIPVGICDIISDYACGNVPCAPGGLCHGAVFPTDVGRMDVLPNGSIVISVNEQTTLLVFDLVPTAINEQHDLILVNTLLGHTAPITSLQVRPGANVLASSSGDRSVRVWDMENNGTCAHVLAHPHVQTAVAWISESSLATGSHNGDVNVWDLELATRFTLRGHTDPVESMVVLHEAGRLASTDNATMETRIWDIGECQTCLFVISWIGGLWGNLTVLSNGLLVAGSVNGSIDVFDLQSECPVKVDSLMCGNGHVVDLKALPGGMLASVHTGGEVCVWEVSSRGGKAVHMRTLFTTSKPLALVVFPDKRLGALCVGGLIQVWR